LIYTQVIVIYNPLGWKRNEVVRIPVCFIHESVNLKKKKEIDSRWTMVMILAFTIPPEIVGLKGMEQRRIFNTDRNKPKHILSIQLIFESMEYLIHSAKIKKIITFDPF
jgi:hypothetical protein